MYSQKIINEGLSALEERGLKLTYHTVGEVHVFVDHMARLRRDDGELKRALNAEEKAWIVNEQLLTKHDFHYYLSRYAYIRTFDGRFAHPTPNKAQQVKLRYYAWLQERRVAISTLALKARQLGSSTLAELIVGHRVPFYPLTYAVVGSSDPDKSALMFDMVELCWDSLPWWLMPRKTSFSTGEYHEFGGIKSHVSIQHGTQKSGIARGTTPNVAHLSELVDFANPADLVDASLIRAMHESPDMFLELESTANGRNDWFHNLWKLSVEEESEGVAKLHPFFLPWFVGSDIYPTETWLRARPIPGDWTPSGLTEAHASRARDYVRNNPFLRETLGDDWRLPKEQQWFYEVERRSHERKGQLSRFLSEMPATPDEAFQSHGNSVFPVEIISDYRNLVTSPIATFQVAGDLIPGKLQLNQLDAAKPPIPFEYDHDTLTKPHRFRLDPVPFEGYDRFDPMGKLLVWEFPQDHYEYYCIIDTGEGIGRDRTVIEMFRKGDPGDQDIQVAEWASDKASAYDVWPVVLALCTFFTVNNGLKVQAPLVVPELAAGGEAIVIELRKLGYARFYVKRNLAKRGGAATQSTVIGWKTTSTSKPAVVSKFQQAIGQYELAINSPYVVDEMADFTPKGAIYPAHDDRLVPCAIGTYVMHEYDFGRSETAGHRYRQSAATAAERYPVYSPGAEAQPVAADYGLPTLD